MEIIHQRFSQDKMTFSKLTIPWLKVHPDIYGAEPLNCIPAGVYSCVPYFSPERQEDCWLLKDVPGHEYIEIHVGNFGCETMFNGVCKQPDTKGCLMYGFGIDESIPMIQRSSDAIAYLHTTIGLKSSFMINIKDM
jgi:hypothetical protein